MLLCYYVIMSSFCLYVKNNYSGLVIGFDEEKFSNYPKEYHVRIPLIQVNYVERPIIDDDFERVFELRYMLEAPATYNFSQCLGTDEKVNDALFYYICTMKEKKSWEAEEEVRLVAALDVLNSQVRLEKLGFQYLGTGYKIPIPLDCVKEIVIGHNFEKVYLPIIKNIAEKYGIKTIEQTKCGLPYELQFEPIEI